MAKCYRCMLGIANLSLWITTVASIVALFAPFWIRNMILEDTYKGLFIECSDPYGENANCDWFNPDSKSAAWFIACGGLWAAGTGLMFIIAVTSFCLCCESCQKSYCAGIITVGIFLAGGALISAIVVFGVKSSEGHDYNLFDRSLPIYFEWGFYVAIMAAGFSIITFTLFSLTMCCMRK